MASRQPERCIPHVWDVFGSKNSHPADEHSWNRNRGMESGTRGGGGGGGGVSGSGERELKHIEKRMSMKKTIRKQISRQLAQAFVENPELLNEDSSQRPATTSAPGPAPGPAPAPRLDCNRNDRHTHNLTLTKSKMLARTDANFFDLLRGTKEDDVPGGGKEQRSKGNNGQPNQDSITMCNTQDSGDLSNGKKTGFWKRLWPSNKR